MRIFYMMLEGFYSRLRESARRWPEHAEQQHQGQRHYQSQDKTGDKYLPKQWILELQVHEECDHAEELDHRQDYQWGYDDAATLQSLRDNDQEFDKRDDAKENRQQAVLFQPTMHALRHASEEKPRYAGIFVGRVFIVGHCGLLTGVGAHLVVASSKPN